jgi:hypothetical protein
MEEGEHSVTRLEDGEQSTTLQEEYEVSTTQLRLPATWLAGEVQPTSWMEKGGGSATRLEYKGKFADKLEERVESAIRLAPLIAMTTFKGTRRYGPLRGPTSSSCGGLRPSAEAFFALRAKKQLFMLFWPTFGVQ